VGFRVKRGYKPHRAQSVGKPTFGDSRGKFYPGPRENLRGHNPNIEHIVPPKFPPEFK